MNRNEILIEAAELDLLRLETDFCILDCRFDLGNPRAGLLAFQSGHIPGSVFADLEKDLSGAVTAESGRHPLPDTNSTITAFRRLGLTNRSAIVVYDDCGGAFAARAWWMLRWFGHENVRLLDGGFNAWTQAGLTIERGAVSIGEGDFSGEPDLDMLITVDELLGMDLAANYLCDAREADRFYGRTEPIDRIAGHIPGARNTPFAAALSAEGHFLSTEQLALLWVQNLEGELGRKWVAMCGSGVTACHLAASALIGGAREPRLYAGSWSEWISDSSRPVSN